jgi:hypothetical protein
VGARKQRRNGGKIFFFGAIVAILAAVVLYLAFFASGKASFDYETTLKDVITASQLRTAEYTYNSIAEVKDGDTTKYYVAYQGTVYAGFDFEKVKIQKEENCIQIIVPDVQIQEVTVDADMDYIFTKDRYDTEQTYAEAAAVCKMDLREKAEQNEKLLKTARESAENTLKALIKPFESQLAEGEHFEIIFIAEGAE